MKKIVSYKYKLPKMKNILPLFTVITFFYSCDNTNNQSKNKISLKDSTPKIDTHALSKSDAKLVEEKTETPIKLNLYYNDIARFISGLPIDSTSRLNKLSKSNKFKEFSKNINSTFSRFEQSKLSKIKTWGASELIDINDSTENVIYPFSGPDIIYAHTILPKANNYYLFGLEPVGVIPEIENYENDSLQKLFNSIKSSISDNLNLSFFITKNMKKDLRTPTIQGTIPILLFFMSRMNLHIQDIQPVKLDASGAVTTNPALKDPSTKKTFHEGVEISFVRPNEGKICHLYYFSINIANVGFENNPKYAKFIKSIKEKTTTLIKSASYCLHEDKFSTIRNLLLNESNYLIQDDSGIPFKYYDPKIWDISLYGTYTGPINAFASHKQEDYKAAFQKNTKEIYFRYGYSNPSNLIVNRKK